MPSFQVVLPLAAAALALLIPSVSAHGYATKAIIDGVEYQTFDINNDKWQGLPPRINRQIFGDGPIVDTTSIDLQCGGEGNNGTQPAKLTVPATAGKEISLFWVPTWAYDHHGPVDPYLARCPSSCTTYMPGNDTVWFKIHEEIAREYGVPGNPPKAGKWPTDDFSEVLQGAGKTKPYKVTIPASLKPGQYLMRHAALALHAVTLPDGKAQWYPTCLQLEVKGSGTEEPSEEYMVAIPSPEYATATSPGVVFSLWNGSKDYINPGPKVWSG